MIVKAISRFLVILIVVLSGINHGVTGGRLPRYYDDVNDIREDKKGKIPFGNIESRYEVNEDLGIEEYVLDKEHHRPLLHRPNGPITNPFGFPGNKQINLTVTPDVVNGQNVGVTTTFVNGQIQRSAVLTTGNQSVNFSNTANNQQVEIISNPTEPSSLKNQGTNIGEVSDNTKVEFETQENQGVFVSTAPSEQKFVFNPNFGDVENQNGGIAKPKKINKGELGVRRDENSKNQEESFLDQKDFGMEPEDYDSGSSEETIYIHGGHGGSGRHREYYDRRFSNEGYRGRSEFNDEYERSRRRDVVGRITDLFW